MSAFLEPGAIIVMASKATATASRGRPNTALPNFAQAKYSYNKPPPLPHKTLFILQPSHSLHLNNLLIGVIANLIMFAQSYQPVLQLVMDCTFDLIRFHQCRWVTLDVTRYWLEEVRKTFFVNFVVSIRVWLNFLRFARRLYMWQHRACLYVRCKTKTSPSRRPWA